MAEELSCTGLKVLVAEDTPVGQKLMKALLQVLGCVADVVANGREAVRAGGNDSLPIIALTAAVTKEDRERSRAAGLDDFLPKPIDPKQLKEKIAKWRHASHGSPSPRGAEK